MVCSEIQYGSGRGTENRIEYYILVQKEARQGHADAIKLLLMNHGISNDIYDEIIKGCVCSLIGIPLAGGYTPEVKAVLELAVKTIPKRDLLSQLL